MQTWTSAVEFLCPIVLYLASACICLYSISVFYFWLPCRCGRVQSRYVCSCVFWTTVLFLFGAFMQMRTHTRERNCRYWTFSGGHPVTKRAVWPMSSQMESYSGNHWKACANQIICLQNLSWYVSRLFSISWRQSIPRNLFLYVSRVLSHIIMPGHVQNLFLRASQAILNIRKKTVGLVRYLG